MLFLIKASDLVLYGAESGVAILAPGRQHSHNVANVNLSDVPADHEIHLKVAVLLVQLPLEHSSSNALAREDFINFPHNE